MTPNRSKTKTKQNSETISTKTNDVITNKRNNPSSHRPNHFITPRRRSGTMSSAKPPPSYNEATTDPGPSGPSPQGSKHQQTTTTVVSEGTASYVRPAGETLYLVHDHRSQYRAYGYGEPASAYVVVSGQPATVVTAQGPQHGTTATTTVFLPTGNCPVCGVT